MAKDPKGGEALRVLQIAGLILMMALGRLVLPARQTPSPSGIALQSSSQNQRPGPPGTIRVRVSLIPVDVSVTDERGGPVTDLKQEDFQIFENGREQEIRHFSIERLSPVTPVPEQSPELRKVPTLELIPQTARNFLILLGRGVHQTYFKCVDDLIRFVRKELLPQDHVAVFAYNRATDFTTDHEKVAQVLERYKKANQKLESMLVQRFGGLAAIYGTKELPKSFQVEIDRIFAGPETLISRRLPPEGVPNKAAGDKDSGIVAAQQHRSEEASRISSFDAMEADAISGGQSFAEYAGTFAMTRQDVQNLFTCIEYLRHMEGSKRLLFFTEQGLFFPRGDTSYDLRIAAVANDARVAIDIIRTGAVSGSSIGLTARTSPPRVEIGPGGISRTGMPNPSPFPDTNPSSETYANQSLRMVAELTGGRTAIYTSVSQALATIGETTRVQYLLGYYPTNDSWDGKYRQIRVKVRRPGLKVSFRHGYHARDTIQLYDREEFLAYSRISAAAGYESNLEDVAFRVMTSAAKDAEGQSRAKIDLLIDPAAVEFRLVNDRHTAKLRIAVFALDRKDRLLGEDWKLMNLQLREETYKRYLAAGIPFSTSMPQFESNQVLKVVVYDTGSDKVGSKLVK